MNHLISNLILYTNEMKDDNTKNLLYEMSTFFNRLACNNEKKADLTIEAFRLIKKLLEVSTDFGFDENLWQCYLTYYIMMNENPFSLTCEKVGKSEGSVNHFAQNDFEIFYKLYNFDFSKVEETLGIDCFSSVSSYQAIKKPEFSYNQNVSKLVMNLYKQLKAAQNGREFFDLMTQFHQDYGVGKFAVNKAFRINNSKTGGLVEFIPINNLDRVMLDDLIGYDLQKKKLIENTSAFVKGYRANNVLLFGDSGTGKSTSIKAIVNEFYDQGLRMIEIYKHQFENLSDIIAEIKNRNYRFIIFMDDLSFEEFEIEYKFLKAIIEGGIETKPDNILIYATSNRRHLIKETWNDRNDMENSQDLHRSDTMQEKLSLVNRFGVSIFYERPSQIEYFHIVEELAKSEKIDIDIETLKAEANIWEMHHGGISGRTAQQFINHLSSLQQLNKN
ncbi:ATP-binding protein [Eubacteriaceae bacterium ES3]|nr:ATP-binding protein [Eubacteriaceae bacterium ES3]